MKIQTMKMIRKIRDDYYKLLKNRTYEERKEFFHELAEKVNNQARNLTENGITDNSVINKGLGINKISHHPEMNFRAIMCRPYGTFICPVRTSHNSPAIYCRESVRDKYFFPNP